MNRTLLWKLAALIGAVVLVVAWAVARAQSAASDPQSAPKVTAEQQKQLDELRQLEQQLQKDRDAVHAAIMEFGWDSDQTDAARDQLFRDREEYRKLRRSLRAAGVAVPPPSGTGWGAGPGGYGPGRGAGRMGYGRGPRGGRMCGCPCWD